MFQEHNTGNEAADSHKPPYGKILRIARRWRSPPFSFYLQRFWWASFFARRLVKCCALRQKQRGIRFHQRTAISHGLHGFFAIWKLWNHYIEQHGEAAELPDHGEYEIPPCHPLGAADPGVYCGGLGGCGVSSKISSARKLAPGEIETLGRFRQAFHALGLAIKTTKHWHGKTREHPDYLVFKRLASGVAVLINGENLGAQAADVRADSFRQITSNRWERSWSSESSHPSTDTK